MKGMLSSRSSSPQRSSRSSRKKISFIDGINAKQLGQTMSAELVQQVQIRGRIETLETVFRDDPLAKDGLIAGLKQELMCAHIYNQQLLRIISTLEWKQTIEYGKSQMRGKQIVVQTEILEDLEALLSESTATHKALRNKLEEVEFDISLQKRQAPSRPKTGNLVARFKRSEVIPE
jgi:hypothetical protein